MKAVRREMTNEFYILPNRYPEGIVPEWITELILNEELVWGLFDNGESWILKDHYDESVTFWAPGDILLRNRYGDVFGIDKVGFNEHYSILNEDEKIQEDQG